MKPLIVANWKCNPLTLKEGEELVERIEEGINGFNSAEVVICPPFVFLPFLIQRSDLPFGAQNCFSGDKGPFTGEISIKMLEEIGVKYVIVGHSERRNTFKETSEEINLKLLRALDSSITPILCIGESREERQNGKTFNVLTEQLEKCLLGVSKDNSSKIVLAYEPVWAIGTGESANVSDIGEVRVFIREFLSNKFGKENCEKIRILYGGSVDSNNIHSFVAEARMNGALVGGASLKANEFLKLIKTA
ncbi:MAG: triose-phosphate isomerase [Minisyncoccales bacterium]